MIKLSIITVNLNNVSGLKKTIDSVVSQTYRDFEWIIIDGGSTDGSRELIEEYADHFTYWVSESDNGVYYAMNKGLHQANGDYVCFLNSGDCFASNTILYSLFSKNHYSDILYGYMMRRSIDGIINSAHNMKHKLDHYDFFFDTFGHQSTFTKLNLIKKLGLFDVTYKMYADWKLFAQAIVKENASYEFIPIKISIYECDGMSDAGSIEELFRIRKEIYGEELIQDSNNIVQKFNLIQEFAWSRFMYKVICRIASIYKKMFFRKRIQQYD